MGALSVSPRARTYWMLGLATFSRSPRSNFLVLVPMESRLEMGTLAMFPSFTTASRESGVWVSYRPSMPLLVTSRFSRCSMNSFSFIVTSYSSLHGRVCGRL